MSDGSHGAPDDDWENALEEINHNKYFRKSNKAAVALGERTKQEVLAKVAGNPEAVIAVDNLEMLKSLIGTAVSHFFDASFDFDSDVGFDWY